MECSCSCYAGDYEVADIYESKFRKARKIHICMECRREIKVGETYEWHKSLYDGYWNEGKTCKQCVTIRDDYGCGAHGELREDIWSCLGVDIVDGSIDERGMDE